MKNKPLPTPKRGDIWWVNFDPSVGGEIKKTRPAVIVSNDMANSALNRIQVIPVTSNTKNLYPAECIVSFGGKHSKAMADQLTTISKLRLISKLDTLTRENMTDIERVMKLQLGFMQ